MERGPDRGPDCYTVRIEMQQEGLPKYQLHPKHLSPQHFPRHSGLMRLPLPLHPLGEETRKPSLQTFGCTTVPKAWSETSALFQLPISSVEPEEAFPSPSVRAFVGCFSRNPSLTLMMESTPLVRGNPGLRSWEASQRPCELLSVALLSCSFIFLISNIDLCYLSKYGAFKKSSLFKKCSGLELRALLSYLAGPTSKGERAAAWSQTGKHNIFF